MNENRHTLLCVDDEKNILQSLKRLLRKEGYRIFTASGGKEGLKILEENDVQMVISDQRMPEMSGTEFLAALKTKYPDILRIILSGYTCVDSITESINQGHIYKFLLKPWNDQNLKLEIKQAFQQYDLIQANKKLDEKVIQQNNELKEINENLEKLVQERTQTLEIQNQALELSRAILEDLPFPVIGISAEGMIAFTNKETMALSFNGDNIEVGKKLSDYFSQGVKEMAAEVLKSDAPCSINGYKLPKTVCDVDLIPLSGRFRGKGLILTFLPCDHKL
ncbi:MAG: response regulator [Deltaproteobacteria bacterium]|nr:response regulator [Deltaproteobacteria bacterium]